MKTCRDCEQELPLSSFYASKRKGHQTYCKACANRRRVQWARDNKEKTKIYRIKHKYGISKEQYDKLYELQNGLCALCKKEFDKEEFKTYVDHDHSCCPGVVSCGKCVRGLLHPRCNTLVGFFETYPEEVSNVEKYLSFQGVLAAQLWL